VWEYVEEREMIVWRRKQRLGFSASRLIVCSGESGDYPAIRTSIKEARRR